VYELVNRKIAADCLFDGAKACGHLRDSLFGGDRIQAWRTELPLDRHGLSDEQWERVRPVLHGKVGDRGGPAFDNRRMLEAVLWIAATGAPWRNSPASRATGITSFIALAGRC
jgi:hypothetical protein